MSHLPFENVKREIVTKVEAKTQLTTSRSTRPISTLLQYGVVNIDKPKGPTSHQISEYAQSILEIDKAGHAGTLDPGVTGCLPIAIDKATRIVQALLNAGKEYVCVMHLHQEVDTKKIQEVLNKFKGDIEQLPPIKSAIKRQLRKRSIYYLDILEIEEKDVLFKVGCQAGTYIRKLCHDIGQELEVGAHMAELRRTKAGPYNESTLTTLQDLSDAYHWYKKEHNEEHLRNIIQPIESAVDHLPKVWVLDQSIQSLCHGIDLKIPGIAKLHDDIQKDQIVAVMTLTDELIALGQVQMDAKKMLEDQKGLAVKINKVFYQK